jgi:ketosteroid isomerase-like protein
MNQGDVDDILRTDEARYQAMIAGDHAALERLLGDDLVYTHSVGTSDTKNAFLASQRAGRVRFKAAHRDAATVRVLGDTAILHGTVAVTVDVGGHEHNATNAFVTVWARRAGAWQLVHWQSTPTK